MVEKIFEKRNWWKRIIFLFLIISFFFFNACDHYCPIYESEETPGQTAFFVRRKDGIYLAKVEYFARKNVIGRDRCSSKVSFYRVGDSGLNFFKEIEFKDECVIDKFYFFNIISPLSYPSDEFAVTFWKGCRIDQPLTYSVMSMDGTMFVGKKMNPEMSRGIFEDKYLLRFGDELFYFPCSRYIWDWDDISFCEENEEWKVRAVSDGVSVDCGFPEQFVRAGMYMDPLTDVPYYFAYSSDKVKVYRLSITSTEANKFKCNFSLLGSFDGKYRKVFFSYPFFAGELTATSLSVSVVLVNVKTDKGIFYNFEVTSGNQNMKDHMKLTLSGLFPMKEGVLLTFSREYVGENFVEPDFFASTWYFENFESDSANRRIKLKLPLGWLSLERNFGGITEYGDSLYAIGGISTAINLDDIQWFYYHMGGCKSAFTYTYRLYRGNYDSVNKVFIWRKIGSLKFGCKLDW